MSQKIQYAILLIPYDGDAVIHSELCPTESEAYEYAHDIIKTQNHYIKDFAVFEVKEPSAEYSQILTNSTTYYDTYKVYDKNSEFVGKFEYHSKDVDIISGKFIYIVKPKAKRYYVAWKNDTLSRFFLEHEKDKMIIWLLKEEE